MKTLLEDNFKPQLDFVLRDPILFGDFKNALEESEPRLYEDIQDFEAAKALFQEVCVSPEFSPTFLAYTSSALQILEEYNERHTPMNLVLFDDALDHLTRVHRVLRMPQGNLRFKLTALN